MGSSASWSLQRSIYQTLSTDTGLTTLLGGPRVYDDVPQDANLPFLTLGQSTSRDWSTGTEDGEEHIVTLHVWSEAGGKKEAQEIIGKVRELLHDSHLPLTEHRLVNLRHEYSEARRDPDGETIHGIIRYRAVTEPEG